MRYSIGSTVGATSSEVTATPTDYLLDTTMTVGEFALLVSAIGYNDSTSSVTGSVADTTFTYKGVNYTPTGWTGIPPRRVSTLRSLPRSHR